MIQDVDVSLKCTQAICVAPTIELVLQIFNFVLELGKFVSGLKVRHLVKNDIVTSKINDHILIGTPGKIKSLLRERKIDTFNLKIFVLDEADELISATTNQLCHDVLHIAKLIKSPIVRYMLFSATFLDREPPIASKCDYSKDLIPAIEPRIESNEKLLQFALKFVPKPRQLCLVPKEELSIANMHQFFIKCRDEAEKYEVICKMYATLEIGQCIIFLNSIKRAENLFHALKSDKYSVSIIHGQLDNRTREITIENFKQNISKILISTNILARGIDIRTVTHIINYDLPTLRDNFRTPDYPTYVHRVGRTARFGDAGVVINFVTSNIDQKNIQLIKEELNYKIQQIYKESMDTDIQEVLEFNQQAIAEKYLKDGKWKEAYELFSSLSKIKELRLVIKTRDITKRGDYFFKRRMWKQARNCYDKALSVSNNSPELFVKKSETLIQMKEFSFVEEMAYKHESIFLKEAKYIIGKIKYYTKSNEVSLNQIQESLKFDKNYKPALDFIALHESMIKLYKKGNALKEAGRFKEAMSVYRQGILVDPLNDLGNSVFYFNMADIAIHEVNLEEALTNANKAIHLNTNNLEAYFKRAEVYLYKKLYSKALQDLDSAGKMLNRPINRDNKKKSYIENNINFINTLIKLSTFKNHYDILQVNRSASEEEIKRAYRKLSRQFHPDTNNQNEEANAKMIDINIANDVLKERKKRDKFDVSLQEHEKLLKVYAKNPPAPFDGFAPKYNDWL